MINLIGQHYSPYTEKEFLEQISEGKMLFGNWLYRCNDKQKKIVDKLEKKGKMKLVIMFPKINRQFT